LIKDLKEFERFLKLCRKQGVTKVTFEGSVVEFGDLPQKSNETTAEEQDQNGLPMLTEEEIAMWSVRGPEQ
jgi:hypothetical protein